MTTVKEPWTEHKAKRKPGITDLPPPEPGNTGTSLPEAPYKGFRCLIPGCRKPLRNLVSRTEGTLFRERGVCPECRKAFREMLVIDGIDTMDDEALAEMHRQADERDRSVQDAYRIQSRIAKGARKKR